jgi:hypothetical protein
MVFLALFLGAFAHARQAPLLPAAFPAWPQLVPDIPAGSPHQDLAESHFCVHLVLLFIPSLLLNPPAPLVDEYKYSGCSGSAEPRSVTFSIPPASMSQLWQFLLEVYALHLSRDLAYIVGVAPINSTLCNTFHQFLGTVAITVRYTPPHRAAARIHLSLLQGCVKLVSCCYGHPSWAVTGSSDMRYSRSGLVYRDAHIPAHAFFDRSQSIPSLHA